ncbi:hypothetical protein [Cupriavidus basilensis]|uniref:hypothetical protein n=1 Tax=Cupriavidus basilensis TaxID=68895 RepID=UPI000751334E|nr:hypothetical protein [Cupriavidus basilensis]
MPFILAGLALIGALIYGAVRLYATVAALSGPLAGAAAVAAGAALLAALAAGLLRRYRAIHGRKVDGERIVAVAGSWGSLRIEADNKRGYLDLGGQQAKFLFADIAGAAAADNGGTWMLGLALEHNAQARWDIPMASRKEALRWEKIIGLAAAQRL